MQSIIAEKRAAINETQRKVCELLSWPPEKYAEFMFETGIEYLEMFCNNDKPLARQLSRKKEFWNWWKNQWEIRDEWFIEMCWDRFPIDCRHYNYDYLHMVGVLICEIAPGRVVLGNDFSTVKLSQ